MFCSTLLRLLPLIIFAPLAARDVIIEFKTAYTHITNSCFKSIYGGNAFLFGPEVTFNLCKESNWYGFAGADFVHKRGCSLGLNTKTSAHIVPLALGVKYFKPVKCADLYAGLGFVPLYLRTTNCSPYVVQHTSQWLFGGVAKIGAYINLHCNYVLDLFINYTFTQHRCARLCSSTVDPVIARKVGINGIIAGAGIGYRF